MESGSTCALDTVFCGHHPGFYENEEFGEAALAKERDAHWADHSHAHPPFSPTHMVPRDVVNTVKGKVLLAGTKREDGSMVLADEVVRVPKGRITLDPSTGDESPNDGIPPERRTTVLPTVRGTGQAIAVVGQAARAAGERAVIMGIDDTSAYCYVQQQRAEWWFNAFPRTPCRPQGGGRLPHAHGLRRGPLHAVLPGHRHRRHAGDAQAVP